MGTIREFGFPQLLALPRAFRVCLPLFRCDEQELIEESPLLPEQRQNFLHEGSPVSCSPGLDDLPSPPRRKLSSLLLPGLEGDAARSLSGSLNLRGPELIRPRKHSYRTGAKELQ